MKQIVDKLNKIAKKINDNVELSDRDLIIDSLDSITKAYGGTPNDSNLIVDKLDDIYNNIAPAVSGNIEITENGENINVAPYATATVNVPGLTLNDITLHVTNNTGLSFNIDGIVQTVHYSHGDYVSTRILIGVIFDNDIKVCTHFGGGTAYVAGYIDGTVNSVTFSDEVNCTGSYDSDFQNLTIAKVDKSLPASITIVFR